MKTATYVHPHHPRSGFTLVELLIALALLGILLTAVVSVNIGTSRAAALLQARNDLLPETQMTQSYIASKLRQASYVFTDGSSFTLNSTSLTTRDPSGSYVWTIGTDPIMAFIVPPRTVSPGQCAAAATDTVRDLYCYTFYAYYGTPRSNMTGSSTALLENPGADSANDGTSWVLMEYRKYYGGAAGGVFATPAAAVAAIPLGGTGRLIMDYLTPTTETGTNVLFDSPVSSATFAQTPGTTNVTMYLAASRTVAGQALSLPATGRYSLTVYPRNLGATQAAN